MNDWFKRETVRFLHEHSTMIIEKSGNFIIDKIENWKNKKLDEREELNKIINKIERE